MFYSDQEKRDAQSDLDQIARELRDYVSKSVQKSGMTKEMLERDFWLEHPNAYLQYNLCSRILRD